MEKLKELKRLITISYGSADDKFSLHPEDTVQASKAIIEANKQEIGLEEYISLHKEYLSNKGCGIEHIEEQLARVRKIESYFKND